MRILVGLMTSHVCLRVVEWQRMGVPCGTQVAHMCVSLVVKHTLRA